jgi:hypothetical protein
MIIMKWKDKKDISFLRSTHDEELVQTRVWSQDIKNLKVVIDYNSMMGGVDISDAFMVTYHSTTERLKNTIRSTFVSWLASVASNHIWFKTNKKRSNLQVGVPVQASRECDVELTQNWSKTLRQTLKNCCPQLRWKHLTTHVTLLPQLPSRTHVGSVLYATRWVSIVKHGTTVKNDM